MKKVYALAGLPRTGSTVLASLLNQHPDIFVSGTSPLLDLLCYTDANWSTIKNYSKEQHPEQVLNIYRSLIQGFYQHIPNPIIIDKHRAWARNVSGLKNIGFDTPKVICTIRPMAEIISSFIKLINKDTTGNNYVDITLKKRGLTSSIKNRCEFIWHEMVSNTHESVQIGLQTAKESMLFLTYDEIVHAPTPTLHKVYTFLDITAFKHHTFDNIITTGLENDDEYWQFPGLHTIRPQLKAEKNNPADIIGKDLAEYFQRFDIIV